MYIKAKKHQRLAIISQKHRKLVTDKNRKLSLQIRLSNQNKCIAFRLKVIIQHL